MQNLVIYGLTSPLVFKLIDAINHHTPTIHIQGIVWSEGDDRDANRYGHPVLGDASVIPQLGRQDDLVFFCNVNRSPREIYQADQWLKQHGCHTINLVHPDIDLNGVRIGTNVFMDQGCLVGPDTTIGSHVTCRMGGIISHEVLIEDRAYLSPGVRVCGQVRLREGCDLGVGATVLPKVTIGKNTIVGAGAVVTKDLPDNVTAVGVPATIIKHHDPHDQRFMIGEGNE